MQIRLWKVLCFLTSEIYHYFLPEGNLYPFPLAGYGRGGDGERTYRSQAVDRVKCGECRVTHNRCESAPFPPPSPATTAVIQTYQVEPATEQ
jgi:hypothetical protein